MIEPIPIDELSPRSSEIIVGGTEEGLYATPVPLQIFAYRSALLESMQERQVTIEGTTHLLARPFLVLATQNPIEYEGTYPLPEAQLDRFLLRVGFGYPDAGAEWEILERRLDRGEDEVVLRPVIDGPALVELQDRVVLGSDFPNTPYPYVHQLEALEGLGLGDDWLRAVLHDNGARLLGRTTP